MPELTFFRHGEELLRIPLGNRTEIGRGSECDVVIPDPSVSRIHAVVERQGDTFHLIDKSGRGTRVGNRDVAEAELQEAVEIKFGNWRAIFRQESQCIASETRIAGATMARVQREPRPIRAAHLRVRQGERERVVALKSDIFKIGKHPSNDLVLDNPYVSSRHARIEQRGGRWFLTDLGSTNGISISGARITHGEILAGAVVAVGDVELVLEIENQTTASEIPGAITFEGMLSCDPVMLQVFEMIERVATSGTAVTILGETGTGKELVARALHSRSDRHDGDFVPVNCSALAATLIESELFGHEKGAFSGAEKARNGAFRQADGGTLFLDEIGEFPIDLQPKLLRALEHGEVKPVGADKPVHVSVRVIAATHRNLDDMVRAGKFREDLFYRLQILPIHLPPLRHRRVDIPLLAQLFLSEVAPRGTGVCFSEDAMKKLSDHDWPGNVRQLRNVVQRAMLTRDPGTIIGADAIVLQNPCPGSALRPNDDMLYVRGLSLEDLERETIRLSLRRNRGSRKAAMDELRIPKSTLKRRIAEWRLQDEGRNDLEPDEDDDEETND